MKLKYKVLTFDKVMQRMHSLRICGEVVHQANIHKSWTYPLPKLILPIRLKSAKVGPTRSTASKAQDALCYY